MTLKADEQLPQAIPTSAGGYLNKQVGKRAPKHLRD